MYYLCFFIIIVAFLFIMDFTNSANSTNTNSINTNQIATQWHDAVTLALVAGDTDRRGCSRYSRSRHAQGRQRPRGQLAPRAVGKHRWQAQRRRAARPGGCRSARSAFKRRSMLLLLLSSHWRRHCSAYTGTRKATVHGVSASSIVSGGREIRGARRPARRRRGVPRLRHTFSHAVQTRPASL